MMRMLPLVYRTAHHMQCSTWEGVEQYNCHTDVLADPDALRL